MPLIRPFDGKSPQLGASVFLAPTAVLIGDVRVGAHSSVWFGAVLRGDDHFITVGERSSIQDNCVIHEGHRQDPTVIGDDVTVGHAAVLHGCRVGDLCIVGMGSTLLDGVVVEPGSIVGAGSVVAPGTVVPAGWLALGVPAKPRRPLTADETASLRTSALHYVALAARYLDARSE